MPDKKSKTFSIRPSLLAKAASQALYTALQRAQKLLSQEDSSEPLSPSQITDLLKTLDQIRFSALWQEKVLQKAERGLLLPNSALHPKAAGNAASRLQGEARRLASFAASDALREFDSKIGLSSTHQDDPLSQDD